MGDMICRVCGEPWDAYGDRHGDMTPRERRDFLAGKGCPCCHGNPNKCGLDYTWDDKPDCEHFDFGRCTKEAPCPHKREKEDNTDRFLRSLTDPSNTDEPLKLLHNALDNLKNGGG